MALADFVANMTHAYRGPGAAPSRLERVPRAVGAYMASSDRFCARANTTQAFGEINRCDGSGWRPSPSLLSRRAACPQAPLRQAPHQECLMS